MTRDEIKQAINIKADEWLESRWSVLYEAIKTIEPHMAEVEAAFDHDYGMAPDTPDTLEKIVSDQVCEICSVVTTHDTEGTMSWGELLELIDLEIARRDKLHQVPQEPGKLIEVGNMLSGVSIKLTRAAVAPSGTLSVDSKEISEMIDCPLCMGENSLQVRADAKCPQCDGTGVTS